MYLSIINIDEYTAAAKAEAKHLLDFSKTECRQFLLPDAWEGWKITIPTGQWSEGRIQNILPHG